METVLVRPAIQVLAPDVVERIAAGEVVERPVSVVRELLDNALDAGARDIRIDVRGGGVRSIRVTDDGSGIPASEIELAFRHHATSKIRVTGDLWEVATLGFRGEALPAIAAVAEVSVVSATAGSPIAVRLELRGGEITGRFYQSRPVGTTIAVRNLFAATPARLKFIGSARSESAQISQLVRRYALAHPSVRISLTLDGHPSLRTSGLGREQVVGEVLGADIAGAMLPLGPAPCGPGELDGLVSPGHITRSSRVHIVLLINGRSVQSRSLLAAFEEGYRPVLPRGRHPIAVLELSLPRSHVDVNVHPSKAEVKVREEAAITADLKAAVRSALGRSLTAPASELQFALGPLQTELPAMVAERGPEWEVATAARMRHASVLGQVHGSLILVEDRAGLYLIDQHRAHERAIYELLVRQHAEGRAGQLLLEPLHIELSAHQLARLEARLPELAALGFQCEWFGGRSFLVRSVPAIPETNNLAEVVEDLLDLAIDDELDWRHRLLTAVACRSSTRRGRSLTLPQARELVELLAETESPAVCPHGSPIILHFSDRFLERQFGW